MSSASESSCNCQESVDAAKAALVSQEGVEGAVKMAKEWVLTVWSDLCD